MTRRTERLVARLERWLDNLVKPDTRYACGGCDDRFQTRFAGVEHVLRCHPEYQGVVVYESFGEPTPVAAGWRQASTNRPSSGSLWGSQDLLPAGVPALAFEAPAV